MRLIMVSDPEGIGSAVAEIAFAAEIEKISRRQKESLQRGGKAEKKDVVDIETSTPKAKKFIDALLAADIYRREDFTITVRQPRAILSGTAFDEFLNRCGKCRAG